MFKGLLTQKRKVWNVRVSHKCPASKCPQVLETPTESVRETSIQHQHTCIAAWAVAPKRNGETANTRRVESGRARGRLAVAHAGDERMISAGQVG
jgi:hypothetical protein